MTLLREKGKRLKNTIATLYLQIPIGKRFFFVTNNSTKSRASFLPKFESFGIKAQIVKITIKKKKKLQRKKRLT